MCIGNNYNLTFSLKDIAQWENGTNGIVAKVPILQRGLVWEQSQVELLWDSILRGIPIGSIVLCKINNSIKQQVKSNDNQYGTHFILDGQQRCNAISLVPYLPNWCIFWHNIQ